MYVFLYYSQPALEKDEKNKKTEAAALNEQRSKNSIYRYELIDNKLVNPKWLFALLSITRSFHNGGAIVIGPDKIYMLPSEKPGSLIQNLAMYEMDLIRLELVEYKGSRRMVEL